MYPVNVIAGYMCRVRELERRYYYMRGKKVSASAGDEDGTLLVLSFADGTVRKTGASED